MQRGERANDQLLALKAMLSGFQAGLWTALPGILQSYDPVKQTCTVQPTIQAQIQNKDLSWRNATLPVCLDVPVVFPGGGGFSLTFPLVAGDEGLLVFASRCIDGWWQQGGIAPQAELRMHDLSDGFFLPGVRSQPRRLDNVSTQAVQLRSDNGSSLVELNPTTGIAMFKSPVRIVLDAPLVQFTGGWSVLNQGHLPVPAEVVGDIHLTGALHSEGAVTSAVSMGAPVVTEGPIRLGTHKHGGIQGGGGTSGGPVP